MKANKQVKGPSQKMAKTPSSVGKPSRAISTRTTLFLYVRAAGRCEFDNCNAYLLEHEPTGTAGNYAERAHIVAFRERGPRGASAAKRTNINHIDNLMLLCKACHTKIDNESDIYTVEVLQKFKRDHEGRVFDLTGLAKDRDTVPLILRAQIAGRRMDISDDDMQRAAAPNFLRLREKVDIDLSTLPDHADPSYWACGCRIIDEGLDRLSRIRPRGSRSLHVSIFALAAIPLLAYLGSKLSDKMRVDLYQRHRNPESWNWHKGKGNTHFGFSTLRDGQGGVGLIINISGTIAPSSIGSDASDMTLYVLAVVDQPPTPMVLNTPQDLNRFVMEYIAALETIRAAHPGLDCLHVFPAVPAPVAISIGRHTLPKVGPKMMLYDQDKRSGTFSTAITLN